MIYSINMHTTVYQFWRFVYHPEQSVIDHYARSSFILYAIILYGDQIVRWSFLWPRRSIWREEVSVIKMLPYLIISESGNKRFLLVIDSYLTKTSNPTDGWWTKIQLCLMSFAFSWWHWCAVGHIAENAVVSEKKTRY